MNLRLKRYNNSTAGFTLIELLVYMAIVGVISSFVFASVYAVQLKARDAKRIADVNSIIHALELFKDQNGSYPVVTTTGSTNLGGWEVSFYPEFIEALETPVAYLPGGVPVDPLNIGPPTLTDGSPSAMFNTRPDGSYFYMYHRYPGGGICGNRPYAVIGFRSLESSSAINKAKLPHAKCGPQPCSVAQYLAGTCRDWSHEFDYSVLLVE